MLGLLYTTCWVYYNPNTLKILQSLTKLFPKHAARGVAQSPYPIYRHGKACLSKKPPWRATGDACLARGRSRVGAPAPAGTLRTLFSPPSLPPSGDSFFRIFPTKPTKVLGLFHVLVLFFGVNEHWFFCYLPRMPTSGDENYHADGEGMYTGLVVFNRVFPNGGQKVS